MSEIIKIIQNNFEKLTMKNIKLQNKFFKTILRENEMNSFKKLFFHHVNHRFQFLDVLKTK